MTAEERIRWALENLPGRHIVTSSFGAQAAVMLHLVTRQKPDTPVVLIDTGYLFPETYRYVDELTERLELNLKVFRPDVSAAWQEARHGQRWSDGERGLLAYNHENKVAPMERALEDLGVGTWFAGIRRGQSATRAETRVVTTSAGRHKVHPIADWSDRDIHRYLLAHDLPYHPLWKHGYVSIGDINTTRPITEVATLDETRFFGLKRECGLHEMDLGTSQTDAGS